MRRGGGDARTPHARALRGGGMRGRRAAWGLCVFPRRAHASCVPLAWGDGRVVAWDASVRRGLRQVRRLLRRKRPCAEGSVRVHAPRVVPAGVLHTLRRSFVGLRQLNKARSMAAGVMAATHPGFSQAAWPSVRRRAGWCA